MRKIILTGVAAAAIGLSACSDKTADKINEAGNSLGYDLERGINNADDHLETGMRKTGAAINDLGDDIGNAASRTADRAGAEADKARRDAGTALKKAGNDLKN
jgi:hypothetical protein